MPVANSAQDARIVYTAQIKAFISKNNEFIASSRALILESRALLTRVDRLGDRVFAGSPGRPFDVVHTNGRTWA
jgi:hypothetical protein